MIDFEKVKRANEINRKWRRPDHNDFDMDKEDEEYLRRRENHLKEVERYKKSKLRKYRPSQCKHNQCTKCHGTGVEVDGRICVHHISCDCPRCSIMCHVERPNEYLIHRCLELNKTKLQRVPKWIISTTR